MSTPTDSLRNKLRPNKLEIPKPSPRDFLSAGATLLNLACSGTIYGAFLKGGYYFFVGDTNSGKTFICLASLAEASINPNFDKYRLILDNGEGGARMDMEKFFGPKVVKRLESPSISTKGRALHSTTIEEFYFHVDDALREKQPFIYILDSMDSLSSAGEREVFSKRKSAHSKGKEGPGSYGDGKAKINSSGIRQVLHDLQRTGSILIVINQTRDNLKFGNQFNPKTFSGGHALAFYATIQMWSSVICKLKTKHKGKYQDQGTLCKVQIKRTRITGRSPTVEIPIYHSVGIDDLGACIDYLIENSHWKETKGIITAPEFSFTGNDEELIQKIEEEGEERELQLIVQKVWREIEAACAVKRKSRYHQD